MDESPLILTLRFDDKSFAIFDTARRKHFPPERNVIPAHLTLFHHLPGGEHAEIADAVEAAAAARAPFPLKITGMRFLGQGTAYIIESPQLLAIRGDLARKWGSKLTPQDAQGFRPHVTIQNKTPAPAAKALFDELSASFEPFEVTATGFLLWHYRGGPWQAAGEFGFREGSGRAASNNQEGSNV